MNDTRAPRTLLIPTEDILKPVEFWARSLQRHSLFAADPLEDIRSELLCAVVSRWWSYDPHRAGAATYADRVAKSAHLNLLSARRARKRIPTIDTAALAPGEANVTQRVSNVSTTNLAIDIRQTVAGLSHEDQLICSGLVVLSVSALANTLGMSRASLRRQIVHIRRAFEEAGLHAYLGAA